ncbi:hypothetical protein MRB53_026914 [Persea americana]|uniref:Uncharacterized protein n=1 Tax=Persea americana TaxID=3435 RepID=A0ACC2LJN2_PERAE|nr:hypothetical protein MRB53_026914 [Persea americana]
MLIACLYVDDLLFTGNSPQMFEEFKHAMFKEFEMTDCGKTDRYLQRFGLVFSFGGARIAVAGLLATAADVCRHRRLRRGIACAAVPWSQEEDRQVRTRP